MRKDEITFDLLFTLGFQRHSDHYYVNGSIWVHSDSVWWFGIEDGGDVELVIWRELRNADHLLMLIQCFEK